MPMDGLIKIMSSFSMEIPFVVKFMQGVVGL